MEWKVAIVASVLTQLLIESVRAIRRWRYNIASEKQTRKLLQAVMKTTVASNKFNSLADMPEGSYVIAPGNKEKH